jgi:hypothetical protein
MCRRSLGLFSIALLLERARFLGSFDDGLLTVFVE